VLQQQGAKIELVLVDNNVAKPPLSVSTVPFVADPRVRIVRAAEVRNAAAARNAGLAAATGEWISYLDDDDAYTPVKIARQLACAQSGHADVVLCGVEFILNGRRRCLQCDKELFSGAALLNEARWATPLIFHRREPSVRFDEMLSAGEDAHFAQLLLAHWGLQEVPVVPAPLVTMYQDGPARPRTNLQVQASWRASRRLWWQFGSRYSPEARRLFALRALVAREKMLRRPGRCVSLSFRLLRTGGAGQLRFVANAMVLAAGFGRGRLVT
jgi:hypothetical protein